MYLNTANIHPHNTPLLPYIPCKIQVKMMYLSWNKMRLYTVKVVGGGGLAGIWCLDRDDDDDDDDNDDDNDGETKKNKNNNKRVGEGNSAQQTRDITTETWISNATMMMMMMMMMTMMLTTLSASSFRSDLQCIVGKTTDFPDLKAKASD